jgi:hypothetical protein
MKDQREAWKACQTLQSGLGRVASPAHDAVVNRSHSKNPGAAYSVVVYDSAQAMSNSQDSTLREFSVKQSQCLSPLRRRTLTVESSSQ